MTALRYQKLPGRGWTWTGPARVWLGEDHVLLVLSRLFTESYRRFFLNDIQAIIIQRTHTGKTWNAVWGIVLAFLLAIALFVQNRTAALVLAALAAPFGVALLINVLLGATCTCYIRTAVKTERVPAINRLRGASEFLARIEPLIIAAQGELTPGQLDTEFAQLQSAPVTSTLDAPPVLSE